MRRGLFNWRWLARTVALMVVVVASMAGPVLAQVNTAQVDVVVLDDARAPLPGAMVKLTSPSTGLQRTAFTNEKGNASLAAMPPGEYKLEVTLDGFMSVAEESITLRVGQRAQVNASLIPRKTEQVTVTGSVPLVDIVKTDSSSNVVPEQIQSLPVAERNFENLAFITPGVQRERGGYRFIAGSPVIGAGGNASQTTIMMDGVDLTDQALGLARTRVSTDAISEFKVINSRFDSEIGGSAGGALSVITKSGTNQIAGSVYGYYRADALRAKGALQVNDVPYHHGQYGFTFGGPVVQDKLHYFASAEYVDEANMTLFRPKGAFVSQAKDVSHPYTRMLGYVGMSWQVSESQRLAGKVLYDQYREKNFRVGGISDVSWGNELNRDNWNITADHSWVASNSFMNELHAQAGARRYDEPTNSNLMEEWFSSGNTLKTGTNTTGHLLGDGDIFALNNVLHYYAGNHELKGGVAWQHLNERSRIDTFQSGLMLYLTDSRAIPLAYSYGVGSADVRKSTDLYGAFVQDSWRPMSTLTLSLGLRYDLDTDGNNPNFHHTLVPNGRSRDTNNYQPRFGFSWDTTGTGKGVLRGGWGKFTGRYLLVPSFVELQQNGETGRALYSRVNGYVYCLALGIVDPTKCPFPILDPNHPTTTGMLSKPQIALLARRFDAPESEQASLGFTWRIAPSLFVDTEGVYVKGSKEIVVRDTNWSGNATHKRINTSYDQINTYTNDGRSEYMAGVLSLNGTLKGGHLITASVTWAQKKNISDDFSPEFPAGYPSDPANIEGEYGRSRSDEKWRFVMSGVFKLPWDITVSPIYEYGSGQPWNRRLGYDYNGDGKNSDRLSWVKRNNEAGPIFRQLSLRLAKSFSLGGGFRAEVTAEAFNLFNTVNYDVNSVDSAEFLRGPTIASPNQAYAVNPSYGKYSATMPSREIQLGLRLMF